MSASRTLSGHRSKLVDELEPPPLLAARRGAGSGRVRDAALEDAAHEHEWAARGLRGPPVARCFIEPGRPDARGVVVARGDDARAAGIERMSIYKMIRRLGLDKDEDSRAPAASDDDDGDGDTNHHR